MQRAHRTFGKYMKRTADESQVSVLLADFEDADKMLTRIIDASKAWRDAWNAILTYQHRLTSEYEGLYTPIVGASEAHVGQQQPAITPHETLERTSRLRQEYEDLKRDLGEEVAMVEERMIRPAKEAQDCLNTLKKPIKKREDRKLDYEHFQNRVDSGRKKTKRSDRENASLAKAESDLARAVEGYNAADEHLRQTLPAIITATFSLLPHILASQIQIQNTLLAHYYTMLHNYCLETGFPSPPPAMSEVISTWETDFKPVQRETESLAILASGKAIRQPMALEDQRNGHALPGANGMRRPSNNSYSRKPSVSPHRGLPPPSPNIDTKPKIGAMTTPSPSASAMLSPIADPSPTYTSPTPDAHAGIAYSPAARPMDYFSRDRQPSSSSFSTAAAAKKPPPPPPRKASSQSLFVKALYDFGGQGDGDLVFREGDRIRVIKKTESTDDWWEGELRGVKGMFPANYCAV